MLLDNLQSKNEQNSYRRAFQKALIADKAQAGNRQQIPFLVLVARAVGSQAQTTEGAANYLKLQMGMMPANYYKGN